MGDSPDQREDTPSSREIFRMASSVPLKYLGLLNHLQLQISCDSQGSGSGVAGGQLTTWAVWRARAGGSPLVRGQRWSISPLE